MAHGTSLAKSLPAQILAAPTYCRLPLLLAHFAFAALRFRRTLLSPHSAFAAPAAPHANAAIALAFVSTPTATMILGAARLPPFALACASDPQTTLACPVRRLPLAIASFRFRVPRHRPSAAIAAAPSATLAAR